MKRADYLNPEKIATPEEQSLYDAVMDITRAEVHKAYRELSELEDTEANREKVRDAIRKAIAKAVQTIAQPNLTNPLLDQDEEAQRIIEILRRIRETQTPPPLWPIDDRPFEPYVYRETGNPPSYYTTDGTGENTYRYYSTVSSSSNFVITTGTYAGAVGTYAGYTGPLRNKITKALVQEIWGVIYGGL